MNIVDNWDLSKFEYIPISDILYIVLYENNPNIFELILQDNSRWIYETNQCEKNTIVSYIIEAVSITQQNQDFWIFSGKPKLGRRIFGFPNNTPDSTFEESISTMLWTNKNDLKYILETICLNMCFKKENIQHQETVYEFNMENKFVLMLYDEIEKTITSFSENKEEVELANNWYKINMILLIFRNIGQKIYCDRFQNILVKCIENVNYGSVFYNVVSICKAIVTQSKRMTKEIQNQKNEICSIIISPFFQTFIYSKIYEESHKIENFELKNIIYLSSLLNLEWHILNYSNDLPIFPSIIKELSSFESLFLFYKLVRCNSSIIKQKTMQIIVLIIKNWTIEQEYHFKSQILSRTLLFFSVLWIYLQNEQNIVKLALSFWESLLISHVECTNLILNLFPLTLFYHVEDKPKPINWWNHEWDEFFATVWKDFSEIKLIWNQTCRNELKANLEKLIENYEQFTDNTSVVLSFAENFCNFDPNNTNILNNSNNANLTFENENENNNYIRSASQNNIPQQSMNFSPEENVAHFSLNYKEIQIEYKTLQDEVFVWQYYLRKIINEKGTPNWFCQIEKPKKFWKKLKRQLIDTNNDEHVLLVINTMTLLYKAYFESIGCFKDYDFFLKYYKNTASFDIKCAIIQWFWSTIKWVNKEFKEQNIKWWINLEGIEIILQLLSTWLQDEKLKNIKNESWTFNTSNFNRKEICSHFIDLKSQINAPFMGIEIENEGLYDETFPNYAGYIEIDEISWRKADTEIKWVTLIIVLFKLLLKRNPVLIIGDSTESFKIAFPLPKMKWLFCEDTNYYPVLASLFYDNENLIQETLDWLICFWNDPITYFTVWYKYCIIDLYFVLMIKYKSKTWMDTINKIYNYHKTFFNFNFLKLSAEEQEFFNAYPKANVFLIRYLPINLIYYQVTHDFTEFITWLYTEDLKQEDWIWNRQMWNSMIYSIKTKLINNQTLLFDPDFKCDYYKAITIQEKGCYWYYVNWINKIDIINQPHFESMIKIINLHILDLIQKIQANTTSMQIESDPSYIKILYKIWKEYWFEISEDTQKTTYDNCLRLYLGMIEYSSINVNCDNNANLFLLCVKILFLLTQEGDIIVDRVIKGIEYVLKFDIKIQGWYEKSLIKMWNFINDKCEYSKDNLGKFLDICKWISKQIMYRFDNQKWITSFLEFSFNISKISLNDKEGEYNNILLSTALPYQFIIICTKYSIHTPSTTPKFSKTKVTIQSLTIFEYAYKILKNISVNASFNKSLTILLGKELKKVFDTSESNANDFLNLLKSEVKTPIFIWNSTLVNEWITFWNNIINDIQSDSDTTNINDNISTFKYKTYENELVIDNVYISIFNQVTGYKLEDVDSFMSKCLDEFVNDKAKKKEYQEWNEIWNAISNCLQFSEGNYDWIISSTGTKGTFIDCFVEYANDWYSSTSKTNWHSCSNFIYVLALSDKTNQWLYDLKITFCLLHLTEWDSSIKSIDKIIKIMSIWYKQTNIEKINWSPFLFLLKKLIFWKTIITKSNCKEITQIRKSLLTLICLYSNNSIIGFAVRSLYEWYLPSKIIDNLFHSKDMTEQSLMKWWDNELEWPDLIWNSEGWKESYKLWEDDCNYILSDLNSIDDFPKNFLNHKCTPNVPNKQGFFFEIVDEYKIDEIYLRLFNKEPNYNIGLNLVNFLNDVINSMTNTVEINSILLISDKLSQSEQQYLHRKLITSLTSIMLIIEQINYNDFNNCLCIANSKEMINLISDEEEYQNNLLPWIQRSFEYQSLLNEDICNKLLLCQNIFYSQSKDSKLNFNNMIHLVYWQIMFLISWNKSRISYFTENFNVYILDYYFERCSSVSDYEIIVLCCIIIRLISKEISYISEFWTKYWDKFLEVFRIKPHWVKYAEMVLSRILNDTQYGDSLSNDIKRNAEKFSHMQSNWGQKTHYYESEIFTIWRKAPELSSQAISIYKSNTFRDNFYEDKNINTIECKEGVCIVTNSFPIVPRKAVEFFNYNELNIEELEERKDEILWNESKSDEMEALKEVFKTIKGIEEKNENSDDESKDDEFDEEANDKID